RAGVFRPDALMPPDSRGKLNSRIVSQMEEGHLNHLRLIDDFALDGRPLRRLLENWADNGLIELDEEWMTMTVSGRFWGVNLTQAVIDTAGINFEEN
ncbi:hypothetical protein LJB99_05070, partial [Deltaproteobacteria bacterium OttesenSCG-928-K17]|nr:hypothetical protein [Deltaproteobacteria bacterium OttesenSCG-928-K17]